MVINSDISVMVPITNDEGKFSFKSFCFWHVGLVKVLIINSLIYTYKIHLKDENLRSYLQYFI